MQAPTLTLEAARTPSGNGTHLRQVGTKSALCGVGTYCRFMIDGDRFESHVTCQKCRKAAGLSHYVTKPRTNLRDRVEAKVDYSQVVCG